MQGCLESSVRCEGGWQVHTLVGHPYGVVSVAFSPDGKRVVSGSKDFFCCIILWDAMTGTEVSSFLATLEITQRQNTCFL